MKLISTYKSSYFVLFLILVLGSNACIEPLELETEVSKQVLVVEGAITTGEGPHSVRLETSDQYGDVFTGNPQPVLGATVWIRDEAGNQQYLVEGTSGFYFTDSDFKVEVNESYTLNISTSDGDWYISTPQKVIPVPPIDGLSLNWFIQPRLSDITFDSGVDVFCEFTDPADEENFYQWNILGEFKITTRPDLFVIAGPNGGSPAPKDCCQICWVKEPTVDVGTYLFKDNLTNGNTVKTKVGYIPDDGFRFTDKYMVVVEQRSLSQSAYQFLSLIQNQLSIQGDIFDPPPATIRGNMLNVNNPEEDVIGFFSMSDVTVDSIFILRDIILQDQPSRLYKDDCRVIPFSDARMPPYWF